MDIVQKLASRPYDVLNTEEARKECEGNPYSLLHVTKAEIDLPEGHKDSDLETYLKVVENFNSFKDFGWIKQDQEEKLYIYAQSMNPTEPNAHWQYGIVACAYSEDYVNKVIKKHELTRKDKEEDRMKHVRLTNANVEPVFFAYPAVARIDEIVAGITAKKPIYDFIAKTASATASGLSTTRPPSPNSSSSSPPRFRPCISLTVTTVALPQPSSARRRRKRTLPTPGRRSTTTL